MKRILFVDDEQPILDGLRNLLRKQRQEWETVFALGGDAALEELVKAPYDVIVSDMRMPGMDGPTLLKKVKQDFPSVARIVLSGHAEKEAMMRALPLAHQFLAKPCDADLLRTVIERTCGLQLLLADQGIREVVCKLDKLPSAPRAYVELTSAFDNPNSSLPAIAEIVSRDPAMSAKVLQLVNSTYFGLQQRVTSVRQAVTFMGTDMLRGIALTAQIFDSTPKAVAKVLALDALQDHSMLVARIARRLFPDRESADEAFTAAMVHDLGKILVALARPNELVEIRTQAKQQKRPTWELEKERIGVTHAELGAYLLGVWGLPLSIVEVVAFHHAPGGGPVERKDILAALHFADTVINPEQALDLELLASAGVDLTKWNAIAAEEMKR